MKTININGKVYEDVTKTRTFKTLGGVEVTAHTTKFLGGNFSMKIDIDSMGVTDARAWIDHECNGTDKPDPIMVSVINGKRAIINAPSELLAELDAEDKAKSQFELDRDAEFERIAEWAVVNDGSYYTDYSICKVVKAEVWDASPYSCEDYHSYTPRKCDYYTRTVADLKGFYDAGLCASGIDDLLKKKHGIIKVSGGCATHPGVVYIVSEEVAKAIVSDMEIVVNAKKRKSLDEEYTYLTNEKAHGRVMPLKEKQAKAKEYDQAFNEGGEGYNPYHYYVSQEHYDEFMARYSEEK